MKNHILNRLQEERLNKISGGIYHYTQITLSYNSNRIEGNELTHEQTRYIFETQTINADSKTNLKTDDIVETLNHFRLFDYMLSTIELPLSEKLIKSFHKIL